MIDINESDLIEFFETLPTNEPNEEKEFFGSTHFDVNNSGCHLSFDISSNFADLYIDLKQHPDTPGCPR
ncbi:MAG: hypothetical protein ABFR90_05090 [Planctomycetota bacterium]